jgi:hypothetical protein
MIGISGARLTHHPIDFVSFFKCIDHSAIR